MLKRICLSFIFLLFLISCGSETSGEKISYDTGIAGVFSSGTTEKFENAKEWKISLTKAYLAVGPVYFYSKEPSISKCPAEAQADKGIILGEVTSQYVVNLLDENITETGKTEGESGICRRAEMYLYPPKDSSLSLGSDSESFKNLNGNSIYVEGKAVKGEAEKDFIVDITIPDEGTMRIIQNISPDSDIELSKDRSGSLILEVLVENWFINVDFDSLTEESDGVFIFSQNEDSQAYTAFLTGVKTYTSYSVKWRN